MYGAFENNLCFETPRQKKDRWNGLRKIPSLLGCFLRRMSIFGLSAAQQQRSKKNNTQDRFGSNFVIRHFFSARVDWNLIYIFSKQKRGQEPLSVEACKNMCLGFISLVKLSVNWGLEKHSAGPKKCLQTEGLHILYQVKAWFRPSCSQSME